MSTKYCVACGIEQVETAEICPKCGTRVKPTTQFVISTENGSKNRYVAAVLALFLGAFGIHKFYLGQSMQGVFYILFCYVAWILAIIDAVGYLCMSDEQFAAKYH